MNAHEKEMINILEALDKGGILTQCIVSGSWCMFFYKYIFEDFLLPVATTDIDIFLPNINKIKKTKVTKALLELDYLRDDDCLTGKTKFTSKSGFELEFLTIPDKTMNNVLIIKGESIGAEALPKMAPAGWNYIQVPLQDLIVNVVSPVSFVLQKLLINKERKDEYKKNKDLEAIKYVLGFIKMSAKYSKELEESLSTYPKKWKKRILETAEENNITL